MNPGGVVLRVKNDLAQKPGDGNLFAESHISNELV